MDAPSSGIGLHFNNRSLRGLVLYLRHETERDVCLVVSERSDWLGLVENEIACRVGRLLGPKHE